MSAHKYPIWLPPISLGAGMRREFASQAAALYLDAQRAEFCTDPVGIHDYPKHLGDICGLDVAELGFRPLWDGALMLSTVGTEIHTDGHGPTMILVLANDGLRFQSRRARWPIPVGTRFIFDDRVEHAAIESRTSTMLLLASVGLQEIEGEAK